MLILTLQMKINVMATAECKENMMNKKLSDVLELPIKVDVSSLTEEERGELQKELFSVGVTWYTMDTIVRHTTSHYYYIDEESRLTRDDSIKFFNNDGSAYISVQQLKEKIKMCKQFSKSDLKDGMVVRNDFCGLSLVIANRLIHPAGWGTLVNYNDDLTHGNHGELTIKEVFEVVRATNLDINTWKLKSIWKREEPPVLSERDKQIISIREKMLELEKELETLQDAKQE